MDLHRDRTGAEARGTRGEEGPGRAGQWSDPVRSAAHGRRTDARTLPEGGRYCRPGPRTQPRGAAVARHRCPAGVGGASGTLREAVRTAVDREHAPRGVRLPVTRFVGHLDLWAGVPEERVEAPCKRSKLGVFSSAFFGSRTAPTDVRRERGGRPGGRAPSRCAGHPGTMRRARAGRATRDRRAGARGRARWGAAPARWPRRPSQHRVARGRAAPVDRERGRRSGSRSRRT